jgi:hypothetical protein
MSSTEPRMTTEQLLTILKTEFPLMSSSRLKFMTAATIVEFFLKGEIEGCDQLNKIIRQYMEEMNVA